DALPFLPFSPRLLVIKIDNRARGNQRNNFGGAKLDRLLHDELHVFAFWDRLRERKLATERRRLSFAQFAQVNLVGAKIDNLGGDFTAAPVEKDDFIAALQPEHIARVMRF